METIRLDYRDYIENLDEICEQIYCELGIVNMAIQIPSIREQFECWQRMNNVDVSNVYMKFNGERVYGNKGTEDKK